MRGDNGVCQQTVQGSTIAEEAADQLQASEKLIAGKHMWYFGFFVKGTSSEMQPGLPTILVVRSTRQLKEYWGA